MEPYIFLDNIDLFTTESCTVVCKAWASWILDKEDNPFYVAKRKAAWEKRLLTGEIDAWKSTWTRTGSRLVRQTSFHSLQSDSLAFSPGHSTPREIHSPPPSEMSEIPGHESSLNPDPSNDLRGMMRAILDQVASPLHLDDGNGDREAPTKIEEDILRLKEVLKGMTKAEPWLDIHGLTLFPKARLPPGFKMPNLTRFDGTGSPTNFLKLYVWAMSPWGVDEPLMAQLFQQYLDGATAHWFLNLEYSKKTSWADIVREFSSQYKYNEEIDVTRRDLETTAQNPNETFSAFITRWRNKAAKMVNRSDEEEQLLMIVKNLLPVYQGRMAFQYFPSFKALISTGTLVEDAIKKGDIKKDEGSSSNTSYNPKFGGNRKTNNNDSIPSKPTNLIHNIGAAPAFQLRPQRNFSPLNMTYAQAFSKLKKANLVQTLNPRPPPRNPPPSYNPNQHCEFHQGPGHDIENCTAFKHRIQDLVDGGRLSVGAPSDKFKNTQPSITNNPLPNHKPLVSINTISTTNNQINPTLLTVRNTPQMYEMPLSGNYVCVVYDHSTQQKVKLVPCKGFDVIFNRDSFSDLCATIGYDGAFCLIDDEEDALSLLSMAEKNVGPHLSTPSRHFKPSYLEDENLVEALRRKEKDRELVEVNKEEDDAIKRMKEVNANVSIWKLLTHSQPHRAAVLRHLNEVSIDASITPDQMVGLIHGADRTLMFTDDDLPESVNHNNSLHITMKCHGWKIPQVLIDNGFAINVCPYQVMTKLGYQKEDLTPSRQVVRAYDNAKRDVLGSIELLLEYGPVARNVEFMVIDIEACFNLLLHRPWLHENRAVASTLHQKVKLLTDHGAVTLVGNLEVMNVSSVGKSVLHLDEEEGSRLDGFTIHNIGFDSSSSWKEEEETEEDLEEDLEEDEETEEDPKEETEEDLEEELQENDNDSEVNPQGARDGTNWSNEDGVEEEPKTPKDSGPCFRGESWTSNSFKHDEGSRKRSRAEDFDLDFEVLCYRRSLGGPALFWYYTSGVTSKGSWGEIAQSFSDWAFEFRQTDTEKLKLVNMEQSDRESFSHLFSRCSYIRARLRFPITDREFMLILLRKLNDFYYQHMVSIKYADLSHMDRHGYEIDAYRLQERRPKVHPPGERANRRIFTRIDEPLSVVYDHLSKKGILCQPMTNQTRKSTLPSESIQEIQDPIPQTLTRGLQLMLKMGYVPGAGLGRNGEGMRHPIPIIDKRNCHGLGFDENMGSKVMKKKSLTLNGHFVLQNDTEPFYEFPEL
uniref:G-patch domain-containing protein n=1 Tax=Chenopodium quinoa TaxID=63459 RepID=A0A803MXN1_CHEQI